MTVAARQLLWSEVAVILGLVALGRPVPVAAALAIVAAVLVAVSWLRIKGRWAHEWLALWWAYRTRRRRFPATSLTQALARGPDAGALVHDDGTESATSVLELRTDGLTPDMLDLPAALIGPDVPTVQLVMHIRPVGAADWQGRAWIAVRTPHAGMVGRDRKSVV